MHKSLSVIISAYNEESHIGACLDSIAAQTDMPDEVIVVDNNSTDETARIARSYPFVKVVHEREQGLIPARNTGYAAARGDILACVNADATLRTDWVARARQAFEADDRLGGLTGLARTDTLLFTHRWMTTFWVRCYFSWAEAVLRVRVLWGACMLVRRSAWEDIRPSICLDGSQVHDDQDMSLLLAGHGWKCARDPRLLITTFGHDYHYWPKLRAYMRLRDRTKQRHQALGTLQTPHTRTLSVWNWLLVRTIGVPVMGIFLSSSYVMWLGSAWRRKILAGRSRAST